MHTSTYLKIKICLSALACITFSVSFIISIEKNKKEAISAITYQSLARQIQADADTLFYLLPENEIPADSQLNFSMAKVNSITANLNTLVSAQSDEQSKQAFKNVIASSEKLYKKLQLLRAERQKLNRITTEHHALYPALTAAEHKINSLLETILVSTLELNDTRIIRNIKDSIRAALILIELHNSEIKDKSAVSLAINLKTYFTLKSIYALISVDITHENQGKIEPRLRAQLIQTMMPLKMPLLTQLQSLEQFDLQTALVVMQSTHKQMAELSQHLNTADLYNAAGTGLSQKIIYILLFLALLTSGLFAFLLQWGRSQEDMYISAHAKHQKEKQAAFKEELRKKMLMERIKQDELDVRNNNTSKINHEQTCIIRSHSSDQTQIMPSPK